MFTGLVRATGRVEGVATSPEGARIAVGVAGLGRAVAVGDSISVSGVCLTATEVAAGGERASFDVVRETLERTTLGALARGARVNLEPALAAGEALGGHFVTGHVDGTAALAARRAVGDGAELEFEADDVILQDIVRKGSVAVDGVSLTVARLGEGRFGVAAIPHTLSATTLGGLSPGARVNVETDMLVKAVRRVIEGAGGAGGGGISEGFLREHGFA